MFNRNTKKIAEDFILNIISMAIPLVVLQLLVLPMIGSHLGDKAYGTIVTLISIITIFAMPLGNALNNTRLLQEPKYEEKKISGDFNLILLGSLIFNAVFVLFGCLYYSREGTWLDVPLIILIATLNLLNEYLIVAFRLKINYKIILFCNVLMAFGYLIGTLLWQMVGYWQLIYLCGSVFSLSYIFFQSNLYREPYRRTVLFGETLKGNMILLLASFLGNITIYADRLILYPLLGATAVSIYYSAIIFSKIISMGISPISSVMLSYISKMKVFSKRYFFLLILCGGIIGFIGYWLCIAVSKWILVLLYPNWAAQSMELIYITTAVAIFSAISSLINPIVLKFCNIKWQIVIGASNAVIYFICTYIFYIFFGLWGFCFGILVSTIFQMLIKIIIFLKNPSYEENIKMLGVQDNETDIA